jgi:hypothetical protein
MIDDEPGGVAEAVRTQPGAVAVAGQHEQVGVGARGDHFSFRASASGDPVCRSAESGLGGVEQGRLRGNEGLLDRGSYFRPAATEQCGPGARHGFDAVRVDDEQLLGRWSYSFHWVARRS